MPVFQLGSKMTKSFFGVNCFSKHHLDVTRHHTVTIRPKNHVISQPVMRRCEKKIFTLHNFIQYDQLI